MTRILLALSLTLLLLAPAGAQEPRYAEIVRGTVERYLLPAYADLHAASRSLAGALESYCSAPSPAGADAVRAAFGSLLESWAGVDFLRFGPMAADSRFERFAFWPDVHGTGARQLRQFMADRDPALLERGALARQSAAVQGLPALESLLARGSDALLATASPNPFRCALAQAVAANLVDIAAAAEAGWRDAGGYPKLLLEPGPDNPLYRSHSEALTEILKGLLTGLEQLRDHRLMAPLGKEPGQARAARAAYAASGNALRYLRASAAALRRYMEASGLAGLLPPDQAWIGNSIRFEFGNLDRALADAGPDLEAALADPERRGKLDYAALVLRSLRELVQNRLSPAAGLTSGFNALDGD